MEKWMQQAMWASDVNTLNERAGCICCCHEHMFAHCPARVWEGCRGQGAITNDDLKAWAEHYGMTLNQFLGGESEST